MKSLLLPAAFLLSLSSVFAGEPLPATLKPEPQKRDPYDWMGRHQEIVNRHKEVKPEYVVIGDSLTHRWGGVPEPESRFGPRYTGKDSWNALFGSHKVTNMGFGFDYVDNAYYRIKEGELDGTSPRVIILLIGTNNIAHRKDSPEVCANNARALVNLLKEKCPKSKILLLGLLPRKEAEAARMVAETNKLYKKIADGKSVIYADPGRALLKEKNGIYPRDEYMVDNVHLSSEGYQKLGEALVPVLQKIDSKYAPSATNKRRAGS